MYPHIVDRSLDTSDEGSSSNAVGDEPWEQQTGQQCDACIRNCRRRVYILPHTDVCFAFTGLPAYMGQLWGDHVRGELLCMGNRKRARSTELDSQFRHLYTRLQEFPRRVD